MTNNDNHSTRSAGRQSSRSKNAPKPLDDLASEIKVPKDSDEVLGAIAGVEKQLESLRGAHEEHRKLSAELASRKAQIEEAAEQVEARETELADREVELAEMRQDLEDREAEIVQRASGIEQRESAVAQNAASIEELELKLENKSKQIDQRVEELDSQLEGISVRKEELSKLEAEAKARLERESEFEEKYNAISQELERTKAALGGKEIELKDRAKVVEELAIKTGLLENQITEMNAKATADEAASIKMVDDLKARLEDTQAQIDAHDQAMQRALDRIDELESANKQHLDEVESKTTLASSLQDQLESLTDQHKRATIQIDELLSQLTAAQSQFESAQSSLDAAPSNDQLETLESKLAKAVQDLESSQAQTKELSEQLNAVGVDAATEIEGANAELASATAKLSEANATIESMQSELAKLTDELAQSSTNTESLKASLNKAESALIDAIAQRESIQSELESKLAAAIESSSSTEGITQEYQSRIDELTSDLNTRDEQIQSLNASHKELEAKLETLNAQSAELSSESQEQLDTLTQNLEQARAREQELMDTITELNANPQPSSSPSIELDEWNAQRRERLDRVKDILRQQSDKVRRATDALRDRYDQCEKVLLKRAELVEAYQAVSDAEAKLARREAKSGAMLGLAGLGILLMMIAGMSWFVAGQVAPGTYASRTTLVAKAGERTLNASDNQSWQEYVEALIVDPQFIEQASKRMKQRGLEDYAIPGTLSSTMASSLDVVSSEPGRVELEFRGQGASHTQRVLDTFSLTVASQANASRARRSDGALTSVEQEATLGDAPLDTTRFATAGMVFGGTSAATFIFGGIFWRRLAKMKANFDRDSRVEGIFNDEDWEVEGRES